LTGHRTFHAELIDTLAEGGCPVCRLATRSVSRYLDILSYENVNDVDLRATIREGIGLCNRHAWQFIDGTRTPLGTAIIYRDLIRTLQQRTTAELRSSDGPSEHLRGLLPARRCVACGALAMMVKDCAHQIQQSWADPAFRAALAESEGLCWAHLLATLEADRFGRRWQALLAAQKSAWARRVNQARLVPRPELLIEALSSAPRLNGSQMSAADAGQPPDSATPIAVASTDVGHCPVCASVNTWLASEGPTVTPSEAGLLCAVHAWNPGLLSGQKVDGLAARLTNLEQRVAKVVDGDLAGFTPFRVAKRVRRGRVLPPEVDVGLGCPICPGQQRHEAAAVAQIEPATLCVPHLRVAAVHGARFGEIRAETRRTWQLVEGQLDEFIRKHDYRFTGEARGEEQRSFRWAVALVAGDEGVR